MTGLTDLNDLILTKHVHCINSNLIYKVNTQTFPISELINEGPK